MQVFVKRADLTASTPPDPIPVIATYTDFPTLPYSTHDASMSSPSVVTVLYLPNTAVERTEFTLPDSDITLKQTSLVPSWRDNAPTIINAEANRRIEEVFPDYKQRNSTAAYQIATQSYGNNPTTWPIEAKNFKNEYDRGWAYVNAIREVTVPLTATMPPDPTSDTYWPTRITPIYFDPIF